jgi:glycine/D-amino acid oxidase-like deaminating enzyme
MSVKGFAPSVASLGALSFQLHKQLADEFNGREKWGYSKSTGTSLSQSARSLDDSALEKVSGEDWLRDDASRSNAAKEVTEFAEETDEELPRWLTRDEGSALEVISSPETVAQVDPQRLSRFLLQQCRDRGVRIHQPAGVLSVSKDIRDELAGVRIAKQQAQGGEEEVDIPCSRLIITAGPWTPSVFKGLFPSAKIKIPITSLAGHSLVLRTPRWTKAMEDRGCHAVFASDPLGFSPELFSRLGGEVYIAGLNDSTIPLPDPSTPAEIQSEAIETLKKTATRLLGLRGSKTDDLETIREGLCFRPVTSSGRPIISRLKDGVLGGGMKTRPGAEGGVFIAAGHGPWGISLSLGTGKVLAEMVDGLATSANVQGLAL